MADDRVGFVGISTDRRAMRAAEDNIQGGSLETKRLRRD